MGRGSFVAIILLSCLGLTTGAFAKQKAKYAPGRLIVNFNQSADAVPQGLSRPMSTMAVKNVISNALLRGSSVKRELNFTPGLSVVQLPVGMSVETALQEFATSSAVIFAEPDYLRQLEIVPNDPYLPVMWNHDNAGQANGVSGADIDSIRGWDIIHDTNIIVAVIDTGLDVNHVDVNDNVWINAAEDAPSARDPNDPNILDGIDNSTGGGAAPGNGYIDDLKGWDFVGADVNVIGGGDNDVRDFVGHGTHVAGIIAADGNNNIGVFGVAWKAKIMPLKISDDKGIISTIAELEAIKYAVANGAKVINYSNGGGPYSIAEYLAIQSAWTNGVLFVASAGNGGDDQIGDDVDVVGDEHYPSGYNLGNIVSVMATNNQDWITSYSNYGLTQVDIAAPGGDFDNGTAGEIYSTMPGNAYGYMAGTSMAAPHVAGAAALMFGLNGTLDCNEVKKILLNSVDKLPSLRGRCVSEGRLNLYKALYRSQAGAVARWHGGVKHPHDSIQEAIHASVTGDTVVAEPNRYYYENIYFEGQDITVRSGDPNVDPAGNPVIYPASTAISAAFDTTLPSVTIDSSETSAAKLVGFTITDAQEGGIYIDNADPEIQLCYIQDNYNTGHGDGGGIVVVNGADAYIHDCGIRRNSATGNGGGIYISDANAVIENSYISDNNSVAGLGGGIYGNNTVCDLHFLDVNRNSSDRAGAGMYFGTATLNMNDCNLIQNESSDNGGGAYLFDTTAAIMDCNISANIAHFDGGGVYWENSAGSISGTTIMDNVADYSGAGMYLFDSSPAIFNCLIARNSTIGGDISCGGAGLYLDGSTSNISSCTFADNKVAATDRFGGGMYLRFETTAPTITDCIFSGNSNYAIYEDDSLGDVTPTVDYCLFGENLPADYFNAENDKAYDANFAGAYNISVLGVTHSFEDDPCFVTGRLGDYYLSQTAAGQLVNSPAVDGGSGTAAALGLDALKTRTDNHADAGAADIGYHYNDSTVIGTFTLTIVRTPTVGGTVTTNPNTMPTFKMYSQVQLTAHPTSAYQVQSWSGTDNDATDSNDNVVTMLCNKVVYVTFETKMIELRVIIDAQGDPSVATSTFTLNPDYNDVRTKSYYRGTLVYITCVPGNANYRIEWSGTGKNGAPNDGSNDLTNWVLMDAPTGQKEEVRITFVEPDFLDVPRQYVHIQDAIDAARNKDTIVISPGTYDISESSNDDFFLTISGKDITLTSATPNNPSQTVIKTNYHVNYGGAWVENTNARNYGTSVTSTPAYGMIRLYNVSRNMIIKGLTFRATETSDTSSVIGTDVTSDGRNGKPLAGGAIALVHDASPTIINCVFDKCTIRGGHGLPGIQPPADGGWGGWAKGGALYCGTGCNPLVRYCSFLKCSAKGGDGGNGSPSPKPGHGGSWDTWNEQDPGWYWGPYQPYWKYSGYGGAVFIDTGSAAEFQNCVFKDNDAMGGSCGLSGAIAGWPQQHYQIDAYGGAVYCASNSSPVFTSCQFTDNQLDPNGVGGVHNDDDKPPIEVALDRINSPYTWGGAVAFEDHASPAFKKCTFTHNSAGSGGAIYAEYADPLISDCTFTKNFGWDAGALYVVEGNYRISRSTLSQNEANGVSGIGGAIVASDANLWVCDSKIQTNKATTSGGGLYVFGSDTSWLMNCLITNNQAGRDGGGISANWYAEPNIVNCTIASNTVTGTNAVTKKSFASSFGGGMNLSYHVDANVMNSIIYNNTAARGRQVSLTDDFVDSETGEVYYNLPSYLRVKYSDIQGGTVPMWFDSGCKPFWGTGNLDLDPKFVNGFYLSQPTGQSVTSPCVNKGNPAVSLSALHFTRHTTRTDLRVDGSLGTVTDKVPDMGYHYIRTADVTGDYNFDGIVNTADINIWVLNNWMNKSCGFPYWCNGRDFNEDGVVNDTDKYILEYNKNKHETGIPAPNPMKFEIIPRRNTTTTAVMTAAKAVDTYGAVYYQFQRLNANGGICEPNVVSPWQTDKTWTDTGLIANKVYSYRVRAKDKWPTNPNVTKWSSIYFVTNAVNDDVTKPYPNPPTWAQKPYAISNGTVSMTATSAKDASGVEYYFDEITGRTGGTDSGWISSSTYTDSGLRTGVIYSYRIRVRDRSLAHNATIYSGIADVNLVPAPTPNPPVWASAPRQYASGINYYHSMSAEPCVDAKGRVVEYQFECVYGNGRSSGWQTSPTYTYVIANRPIQAAYKVRARVRLAGGIPTAYSDIRFTD